ncbi:Hypothetical protein, putative [Bodo saltans]|uniref:Leucine-rich repeat protein n=1 Tax=Bodo saltans TaxID=75058 RepID=A0A0S4KNZ5_BODSA|nr:Hypothetical protein, putative [Bodo saltans]|eukprot:CUI15346.1 Hypothetical protein, putative [Bodo saltans]
MGTVLLQNKRITTFFGLKDVADRSPLTELHMSGNELDSFEHFGTHSELQVLHLEDNRISSFLGMTKQKSLHSIFLRGCPVAAQPHYRIMALLTVGFSLKFIDGKAVDASERDVARKLGPSAALAVSYGWLLDTTPRSAADYDKIIVELRKARRSLVPDTAKTNVRTIVMSLAAATVESHDRDGLSVTAETVELQNRALLHFAKRVAQLEQMVTDLHGALAAANSARRPQQPAEPSAVSSIGQPLAAGELCAASSIVFTRGISVGGLHPSSVVQCVIHFGQETIEFQNFFTRNCVAEVRFSSVTGCRFQYADGGAGASKILLATVDGLVLDIAFQDAATFVATAKVLKVRCPVTVPEVTIAIESDGAEIRKVERNATQEAAVPVPKASLETFNTQSRGDVAPKPETKMTTPTSHLTQEVQAKPIISIAPQAPTAKQAQPSPPSSPLAVVSQRTREPKVSSPKQTQHTSRRSASSSMDFGSSTSAELTHKSTVSSVAAPVVAPSQTTTASSAPAPVATASLGGSVSLKKTDSSAALVPASRGAASSVSSSGTASNAPPESLPPRRAPTKATVVTKDDDSDSPPRPAPKRTAWRGKEIKELMIDSSDSD